MRQTLKTPPVESDDTESAERALLRRAFHALRDAGLDPNEISGTRARPLVHRVLDAVIVGDQHQRWNALYDRDEHDWTEADITRSGELELQKMAFWNARDSGRPNAVVEGYIEGAVEARAFDRPAPPQPPSTPRARAPFRDDDVDEHARRQLLDAQKRLLLADSVTDPSPNAKPVRHVRAIDELQEAPCSV